MKTPVYCPSKYYGWFSRLKGRIIPSDWALLRLAEHSSCGSISPESASSGDVRDILKSIKLDKSNNTTESK